MAQFQPIVHHADPHAAAANVQGMQDVDIHVHASDRTAVADHGLPLVGDMPLVPQ